jgi:hypothetical protein
MRNALGCTDIGYPGWVHYQGDSDHVDIVRTVTCLGTSFTNLSRVRVSVTNNYVAAA